ncbi:hypothetical protein [Streptomyces sp. NPDC093089]|uniref:hypothetical protein n=1 Tax=Streptomyces sp. NPDC093089 TaxID=3366024 RepID=UPI003813452E
MPRTVWLLVAARAVNRLGAFSLPFLTVLISTEFGAGVTTAGLLSSGFGLATIPSRLAGGRLARGIGRRRTIVLGLTGRTEPVRPWRDRALRAVFLSGTLFALVTTTIAMGLPLTLARRDLEPVDAGLLFTASAVTVVAAQPVLRLRRLAELSDSAAVATGHVLLAVGLAGYAVASTLPAFLAATVLWSLGDVLVLGRVLTVVADLAPPGGTDGYLAAYGISRDIATVAAPVTSTQLLAHVGVGALWTGAAFLCLALAVAQPLVVGPLVSAPRRRATERGRCRAGAGSGARSA